MSDLLADRLTIGNPTITVSLGKMSLEVGRLRARQFRQKVFTSHVGTLRIIGELDVHPDTCIIAKVC